MKKNVYIIVFIAIIAVIGLTIFLRNDDVQVKIDEAVNTNTDMKNVEMLSETSDVRVTSETIEYGEGYKGLLSRPDTQGEYEGVVMIHEWWGLNDNIKDMAKLLAAKGYIVLAVDLYDGKVATTQEEARVFVSSLDQKKALKNMKAAISELKNKRGAKRIASLGWCFGGGQSLQLALSGEKIDATIIYYGNLVSDKEKLSSIQWPILGIFGDQDTSIPVQTVNEFKSSIDSLGIKNEIYIYPGVGHAFANPSGRNFAPDETKDAWQKTLAFLKESLSSE